MQRYPGCRCGQGFGAPDSEFEFPFAALTPLPPPTWPEWPCGPGRANTGIVMLDKKAARRKDVVFMFAYGVLILEIVNFLN